MRWPSRRREEDAEQQLRGAPAFRPRRISGRSESAPYTGRCADVGDATVIMDSNLRQAKVLCARNPRVQPYGARIEIIILGEEAFLEAIETKAQLVDFRCRKNLQIRD